MRQVTLALTAVLLFSAAPCFAGTVVMHYFTYTDSAGTNSYNSDSRALVLRFRGAESGNTNSNITSIKVNNTGTLATGFINKVSVYYFAGADDLYDGNETLFGATSSWTADTATVTNAGLNFKNTDYTFHVVYDIARSAPAGKTIDARILLNAITDGDAVNQSELLDPAGTRPVLATDTRTAQSTVTSAATYVVNNNSDSARLTATFRNGRDTPVAGHAVYVSSSRGSAVDTISGGPVVTGFDGTATLYVSSGTAGTATISVADTTDGCTILQTCTVVFVPAATLRLNEVQPWSSTGDWIEVAVTGTGKIAPGTHLWLQDGGKAVPVDTLAAYVSAGDYLVVHSTGGTSDTTSMTGSGTSTDATDTQYDLYGNFTLTATDNAIFLRTGTGDTIDAMFFATMDTTLANSALPAQLDRAVADSHWDRAGSSASFFDYIKGTLSGGEAAGNRAYGRDASGTDNNSRYDWSYRNSQSSMGRANDTHPAVTGEGSATIAPAMGGTGEARLWTLTCTAGSTSFRNGYITVDIPAGWSTPQLVNSAAAGFTTFGGTLTRATADSATVIGQKIIVPIASGSASQTLIVYYGDTTANVAGAATSAAGGGVYTFTIKSDPLGARVMDIATQPSVTAIAAGAPFCQIQDSGPASDGGNGGGDWWSASGLQNAMNLDLYFADSTALDDCWWSVDNGIQAETCTFSTYLDGQNRAGTAFSVSDWSLPASVVSRLQDGILYTLTFGVRDDDANDGLTRSFTFYRDNRDPLNARAAVSEASPYLYFTGTDTLFFSDMMGATAQTATLSASGTDSTALTLTGPAWGDNAGGSGATVAYLISSNEPNATLALTVADAVGFDTDATLACVNDIATAGAPSGFALNTATDTAVSFTWTAYGTDPDTGAGFYTYRLYYSQSNPASTASSYWDVSNEAALGTVTTGAGAVGNLTPNTTYYFKIAGVDRVGNVGPLSPQLSTTTASTTFASDLPWATAYHNARRVARDSNGNIYVVFPNNGEIYCVKSTNNGVSWGTPVNVSDSAAYTDSTPTVVVDSTDTVHVAWTTKYSATLYEINYKCSTNGGATWSSWKQVSDDLPAGYNYNLYPCATQWSTDTVIFGYSTDNGATFYAMNRQLNFRTGAWRNYSAIDANGRRTLVTLASSPAADTAWIIYNYYFGPDYDIKSAYLYTGALTSGGDIAASTADESNASVVVDARNRPHAVYLYGSGGTFYLVHKVRNGNTWSTLTALDQTAAGEVLASPMLNADGNQLFLFYGLTTGGQTDIYHNQYDPALSTLPGGGWNHQFTDDHRSHSTNSATTEDHPNASAFAGGDGSADIVWTEGSSAPYGITYLRYANTAPPAATVKSPADGSWATDNSATLIVNPITDADEDKVYYRIQVDNDPAFGSPEYNGAWGSNSVTTGVLATGTWYWRAYTSDARDTTSPDATWSFIVRDDIPPVTEASFDGTLGSNGWYNSSGSLTLSVTDTQSGLAASYYVTDSAFTYNSNFYPYRYTWTELSTGLGSTTTCDTDSLQNISLGFTFPVYSGRLNSYYLFASGYLLDTSFAGSYISPNQQFPAADVGGGYAVKNAVSALWDDYHTFTEVWYRQNGSDSFIVQYDKLYHDQSRTSAPSTCQITLYPSGRVILSYDTIGYTDGVTVGMNKGDGSTGFSWNWGSVPSANTSLINTYSLYSGGIGLASDSIHQVEYYSADIAGNAGVPQFITIKIDKTAPRPAQPAALTTYDTSGSITVTWSADTGYDTTAGIWRYGLLRSTDGGASSEVWTGSAASDTSRTDTGRLAGHTYAYQVKTYDYAGNSAVSNAVSTTVDTAPPGIIYDLTATAAAAGRINLTWTAVSDSVSGVSFYRVYRSAVEGALGAQVNPDTVTATGAYTDTTTTNGTTYWYTVRAVDNARWENTSALNDTASATADAASITPAIRSEPLYTCGTANTITCDSSVTGGSYQFVCDTDAAFAAPAESTAAWVNSTAATAYSVTFTGLRDGTLYYHRVRAATAPDGGGTVGGWSGTVSSTQDSTPPPAVTVAATATTGGTIALAWSAVTDTTSGTRHYRIFRSTAAGTLGSLIDTTTAVAYSDSPVHLGDSTTYWYTVRGVDNVWLENQTSGNYQDSAVCDKTAPVAPVTNSEPAYSPTASNSISCTDPAGAAYYYFECDDSSSFATPVDVSGWVSDTAYTFSSLSNGQRYWYRVRAKDAAGNIGAWSNTVYSLQDITVTDAASLAALSTWTSAAAVPLSWAVDPGSDDVSGLDTYVVLCDSGAGYVEIATLDSTVTGYTDNSVLDGTAYAYRLRTLDVAGNTALAAIVSTTIDQAPPAAVVDLAAAVQAGGEIRLTWTAVTDATSGVDFYRIYRSTNSASLGTQISTDNQVTGGTYSDTDISNGTTYWYTTRAVDNAGNENTGTDNTADSATADTGSFTPSLNAEPAYTAGTTNLVVWNTVDPANDTGSYYAECDTAGTFASVYANSGWLNEGGSNAETFSHTFPALANHTKYYFRVRHSRAAGGSGALSDWSTVEFSTQDNTAPTIPAALSITPGTWSQNNSFGATWSASRDTCGVAGYYYTLGSAPDANGDDTYVTGTSLSGLMAPAEGATAFHLYGKDNLGNMNYLLRASATLYYDATVPNAIADLDATAQSDGDIALQWSDGSDATSGVAYYQVWQSDTSATAGSLLDTVAVSAYTIAGSGLTAGATYYYRVRAVDRAGNVRSTGNSIDSAVCTKEVQVTNYAVARAPLAAADSAVTVFSGSVRNLAGSDVLERFALRNLGTLGTGSIQNVRLWQDADASRTYTAGDTLISTLTEYTDTWGSTGLTQAVSAAGLNFVVTIDTQGTLTDGDWFQGRVDAGALYLTAGLAAPASAQSNSDSLIVNTVIRRTELHHYGVAAATVYPGDDSVPVMAFTVPANGSRADTLTRVTIDNAGDLDDAMVRQVYLHRDGGTAGTYQPASDPLIAVLARQQGMWRTATAVAAAIPAGDSLALLVLIDLYDTATSAGDFQGRLPVNGCTTAAGLQGPSDAPLTSGTTQHLAYASLRISEVAPAGTPGVDSSWLEIYCSSGPFDASDLYLTDMEGAPTRLAATAVTLATGDLVLVHCNSATADEDDGSGKGGNGVWDLYVSGTGENLNTDDDQVAITASSTLAGMTEANTYDAVIFTSGDGTLPAAEQAQADSLVALGHWTGDFAAGGQAHAVLLTGGDTVIARYPSTTTDNDTRADWTVAVRSTPGYRNRYLEVPDASGSGGSASVTATLRDASGTAVSGDNTTYFSAAVTGSANIATARPLTLAAGQVSITVTDAVAEAVTLSFSETAGSGYCFTDTAIITYTSVPTCTFVVPVDGETYSRNITCTYVIYGSGTNSLVVEYSDDGGLTWAAASVSGDYQNVAADANGETYSFLWNSEANLGYTEQPDIRLRLIPSCGASIGPGDTTGDFGVDNELPPATFRINEVYYQPGAGPSGTLCEWFELANLTGDTVDLGGWRVTESGEGWYTIPNNYARVGPYGYVVIARDTTASGLYDPALGYTLTGVPVVRWAAIALANAGGTIAVSDSTGATHDTIAYKPAWGGAGDSCSAEKDCPSELGTDDANWAASGIPNGTPGHANSNALARSTLEATGAQADGSDTALVTVTLLTADRKPVPAHRVTVIVGAGSATVQNATGYTDGSGQYTATLTATTVNDATCSGYCTAEDTVALSDTALVRFFAVGGWSAFGGDTYISSIAGIDEFYTQAVSADTWTIAGLNWSNDGLSLGMAEGDFGTVKGNPGTDRRIYVIDRATGDSVLVSSRTMNPCPFGRVNIADFDQDGSDDVIFGGYVTGYPQPFWGIMVVKADGSDTWKTNNAWVNRSPEAGYLNSWTPDVTDSGIALAGGYQLNAACSQNGDIVLWSGKYAMEVDYVDRTPGNAYTARVIRGYASGQQAPGSLRNPRADRTSYRSYYWAEPVWSPDGRHLAMTRYDYREISDGDANRQVFQSEIWVLKNAANHIAAGTIAEAWGSHLVRISPPTITDTTAAGVDKDYGQAADHADTIYCNPQWSRDGKVISYAVDRTASFDLDAYLVNPNAALAATDFDVVMRYVGNLTFLNNDGAGSTYDTYAELTMLGAAANELSLSWPDAGTLQPASLHWAGNRATIRTYDLAGETYIGSNGGILIDDGVTVAVVSAGDQLATGTVIRTSASALVDPGTAYDTMVATGVAREFWPEGFQSSTPLMVILHYDAADLAAAGLTDGAADETSLKVFWWNDAAGSWDDYGGVVDPDANTITFFTTHFSRYALFRDRSPVAGLSSLTLARTTALANGSDGIEVTAYLANPAGPLAGVPVKLQTGRGDTIDYLSTVTGVDGTLRAFVRSRTPGTAVLACANLTAIFPETFVLTFISAADSGSGTVSDPSVPGISIIVPAGAFDTAVGFTLAAGATDTVAWAAANTRAAAGGPAVQFLPAGRDGEQTFELHVRRQSDGALHDTGLLLPARVVFAIPPGLAWHERSALVILLLDERDEDSDGITAEWLVLPTTVDEAAGTVRAEVRHFSVYRLGAQALTVSGMNDIIVYPNPWRSDRHAGHGNYGIKFLLPVNRTFELKLYTLAGDLVAAELLSTAGGLGSYGWRWDLANARGERVASGVYLAVIRDTASGETTTRKIAVID